MQTARLPCVAIVGRPNVGKSSLFNRIAGKRLAVVEAEPGITRDRLHTQAEWNGRRFEVVDTGGIVFGEDDPLFDQVRMQAHIAIEKADVIVFMVDCVAGVTPADKELAASLRKLVSKNGRTQRILVAANKADNPDRDTNIHDFHCLGFKDIIPVSAIHGRGFERLMDQIISSFPETSSQTQQELEEVKIAIVGRPNVGKSSLLNAIVGQERAIVSEIPGTTRDALDTRVDFDGQHIVLIDTAGLRRRGKVQQTVEYYMTLRAERAILRSDVAMVVIDGSAGLTDGDKRVAKAVHSEGKGCVLVVNKWDVMEPPDGKPQKRTSAKTGFASQVRKDFPELCYAPICFTSATKRTGIKAAVETALEAAESNSFRAPTGALNRVIREAAYERPYSRRGRALKIYYVMQAGTAPPRFVLYCNDPKLVHFSYRRFLESRLRAAFPLEGTPIRLEFRSSHERRRAAS